MLKSSAKFIARQLLRLVDNPKKLRRFGDPLFWITGFRRPANQSGKPANVAVVKLDRLGDVVLSSHLLAELRRAWPEARITLLVREALVDLARLCPDVDEVIGVPAGEGSMVFNPKTGEYFCWKHFLAKWALWCYRAKLWQRRFDVAIVPRWDTDYYGAIPLAYLIGAAQRWGVTEAATSRKAIANRGFDQLLTQVIKGQSVQHDFLLNESILQALGIPARSHQKLVSWVSEADHEKAAEIMRTAGAATTKLCIVVCMGANMANRRMWPVESYARLCQAVFDPEMVQILTFGTAAEKKLGRELKERLGDVVINLEGKLPLNLLPAAVSLGVLYIGSDTGTLHLAAAAGLPVFEISCHPLSGDPNWAESPLRFGPWAVPQRIVQPKQAIAPCETYCAAEEAHCILEVSVGQATIALRSVLEQAGLQQVCLETQAQKTS